MLCCGYGVNDIFISVVIFVRNGFWNKKVNRIIFSLKLICEENGYFFIDNSNIETRDLWRNGVHLLKSGMTKLAQNFIYLLINFIFILR